MQTPPPLLRWPLLDPEAIASAVMRHGSDPQRLGPVLLESIGIDLELDSRRVGQHPSIGLRCHATLGPYAIAECEGARHVECLPLDRLRVDRLLERGWAGIQVGADLAATLHGHLLLLAELMLLRPEIAQIELEGVECAPSGEIQAHLNLQWNPVRERAATAFAPFPWSAATPVTLEDGQALLLRAIRAEDEPQLQLGFTQLSPDEVRMRFLFPLKSMTHDLAARLTQLDYDREIALVLADQQPPGQSRLFGVVRASFDPTVGGAEFAIVIPRQLTGQGLGTRLLQRIIELTRAAGMRRIFGDTLPENQAMRALARKCGFREELRDHLIRITREL